MIIKTEYADFICFADVLKFMQLENKDKIFIQSADWWGIECVLNKQGITLSIDQIDQIVNAPDSEV